MSKYDVQDIYDIVTAIRRNPGLYFKKKRVELLHAFLNGVRYESLDSALLPEVPSLDHFNHWLPLRLDVEPRSRDWASVIVDISGGDGPEAWDLCFKLLEEFRTDRPRRSQARVDPDRHYSRIRPIYSESERGPAPSSVSILTYTKAPLCVLRATLDDGLIEHMHGSVDDCKREASKSFGLSDQDWVS